MIIFKNRMSAVTSNQMCEKKMFNLWFLLSGKVLKLGTRGCCQCDMNLKDENVYTLVNTNTV